jgi:hypothetical protein
MKYSMDRHFNPQDLTEGCLLWNAFGTGHWKENRG